MKCADCKVDEPGSCLYEADDDDSQQVSQAKAACCSLVAAGDSFQAYRARVAAGQEIDASESGDSGRGLSVASTGHKAKVLLCPKRSNDCHCLDKPATCTRDAEPRVVYFADCVKCIDDGLYPG